MKKLSVVLSVVFILALLMIEFSTSKPLENPQKSSAKTWVAPESADTLKNPFKGDKKATEAGKKIYAQLCAVCHGNSGKGDGIAGMSLKPRPADLTSETVQKQSDGAIFWKITTGRPPMASYKATLTDEQRWQVVNYIRTFRKEKSKK